MVFRALRKLGREAGAAISDGIQQYQQQQHQSRLQQNLASYQYSPPGAQATPQPLAFAPTGPTAWGLLILPDRATPSSLFVALLDAIFTLALAADTSTTADILTPTRLAAVYDELGYQQADNLPFLLHRHAQRSGGMDPRSHVNEGMQMAWRVFGLEHTVAQTATGTTAAGLTRRGFRDMMVRDGLIYPVGQAAAYSGLLARRRDELAATAGVGFPPVPIGAESFMPTADVPQTGHTETQRVYRERQAQWVGEYQRRFGGQLMGADQGVGMGGGWPMAMQLENFRHRMTMDAMTPGYRVGDRVYYTGGLNW